MPAVTHMLFAREVLSSAVDLGPFLSGLWVLWFPSPILGENCGKNLKQVAVTSALVVRKWADLQT